MNKRYAVIMVASIAFGVGAYYLAIRKIQPINDELGKQGATSNPQAASTTDMSVEGVVSRLIQTGKISNRELMKTLTRGEIVFAGYWGHGCCGSDIRIYDISNLDSPKVLATYNSPQYINDFVVAGKYLFVAGYPTHPSAVPFLDSLEIVDVSNPSAPRLVASPSINGEIVKKMGLRDGKLIISGDFGERAVDFTDINNPKVSSSTVGMQEEATLRPGNQSRASFIADSGSTNDVLRFGSATGTYRGEFIASSTVLHGGTGAGLFPPAVGSDGGGEVGYEAPFRGTVHYLSTPMMPTPTSTGPGDRLMMSSSNQDQIKLPPGVAWRRGGELLLSFSEESGPSGKVGIISIGGR